MSPNESDTKTARATYSSMIERFGKSWEEGNAESIAEIFSEDGVLLPDPFDPPLRGRPAILEYWKDIPREQAEISFRFGEIYLAGPWFGTEFKCTFRRRRTGSWVDVRGALFCETSEDFISEMRMYWHRESPRLIA